MARIINARPLEPVIDAAQQWIADCLISDGSMFSRSALWTANSVEQVRHAFVDHPDEGGDDFLTKLKGQMAAAPPLAQCLMAEMLWAVLLFPSNISSSKKRELINEIWSMSGQSLPNDLPILSDEVLAGIGSAGQGYNNHRWRELVFLISLVGDLKQRPSEERQTLLLNYDAFVDSIAQIPRQGDRQFRHMLRFFCFPDRVERMSSNRERRAVLAAFGIAELKDSRKWDDRKLDEALLTLRKDLQRTDPSAIIDFYEPPLLGRWRKEEDEDDLPDTPIANPGISFSAEDCVVFAHYPNSVSWKDVKQSDREIFKGIWAKLKELSRNLALSPVSSIPLKAGSSLYERNGRSPKEIWSCVYPKVVRNKSYGLQIALIISDRGAEVCFCVGAGRSQAASKLEFEQHLRAARNRLDSVSDSTLKTVSDSQDKKWFYRRSWLATPNQTDFGTLREWVSYASTQEGNGASISHYYTPKEVQELGTRVFDVFEDALRTFLPILNSVYSNPAESEHWIFQGDPDQFDVDKYVSSRREIVWTVRQQKLRIRLGDNVLIWRAGPKSGVIAQCSVIAPPSKEILEDAPELWKGKSDQRIDEMRCRLRVENSFVNNPILRTSIKSALPDLSIIRAPQGTNFEISLTDYDKIMSLKEVTPSPLFDSTAMSLAYEAIVATHMQIDREFLGRFVDSLVAKPFLILSGNSGTGKTKLAELFVQWLCRNAVNQFTLVPVGADWTDNRNVLGFVNHLRVTKIEEESTVIELPIYQTTRILDLMLEASRGGNESKPYFLILDEMNLSHVERYFADFLSALELKSGGLLLHREGRELPRTHGGPHDVPEALVLPPNLFVIGTVNVDETTYMFSPKVLDRANVIEFRVSEDAPDTFLKASRSIGPISEAPIGLADGFLELSFRARGVREPALHLSADSSLAASDGTEGLNRCHTAINDLFSLMQRRHQEFAFRTMTEILRFLAVDYELTSETEEWDWKRAMDAQILQKILPKLHGSKRKIGSLLASLAKYCEQGDRSKAEMLLQDETKAEAYLAKSDKRENSPMYKYSYLKLGEMMDAVRRDQFVSFIQ